MCEPKREKPSKRSKKDSILEQEMMGDLARCIVEVLQSNLEREEEPFENYAYQLRMRLHTEAKDFHDRFIQGYEVLLEQLSKSQ